MPEPTFVIVSGYGSTGSSAVVDLLSEVNICRVIDEEFRFLQDPDGLIDLCENLTEKWGWVRSDAYIRRFIKYTDTIGRKPWPWQAGENLDNIFNNEFFHLRNRFLSEIVDTQWQGHWHFHDYNEKTNIQMFVEKLKRYLKKYGVPKTYIRKITSKSDMYFVRSDCDVYSAAKKFLTSLFQTLPDSDAKFFVLDQGLLPYNQKHSFPIFNNLRQIIVDRDPRDVFLDARTYNAYPITQNVESFISFYETCRNSNLLLNDNRIQSIQFEDLIYNYDETVSNLFQSLNLLEGKHSRLSIFKPDQSIKNTKTWHRKENKKFSNEIREIEKKLERWCYDF